MLAGDAPAELSREEVSFGYRHSSLAGSIVTGAVLELRADEPGKVARLTREYLDKKRASQPLGEASAGCVFRNPPPPSVESAGALIESAGLKGQGVGGAVISPVHANFIINSGLTRAEEVLELVERARAAVLANSGVKLELEIELW